MVQLQVVDLSKNSIRMKQMVIGLPPRATKQKEKEAVKARAQLEANDLLLKALSNKEVRNSIGVPEAGAAVISLRLEVIISRADDGAVSE